jgi:type I restriction enzyme M protein
MNKNLGDKSHRLTEEHISEISNLFGDLEANGRSKILPAEEFGYRRIVIDRPLRLKFQATPERIADLDEERAFTNRDEEKQNAIKDALSTLPEDKVWMDREEFHEELDEVFDAASISVTKSVLGNIENVLGERDSDAAICRDGNGQPEHDTDLRDRERVPLGENPHDYFEREIKPYVPNAWINESSKYHDDQDGELGVVGYEINFNKYFFEYDSPRPLNEIDDDIQELEEEISQMLQEVTSDD